MQNVIIRSIERLDFRTKEAYKTLRTNLSFAGKNVKVISLTSCTPNEGKTSVSFPVMPVPCRKRQEDDSG